MTRWEELPDGTEDIGEAFLAELERMGLEPDDEVHNGVIYTAPADPCIERTCPRRYENHEAHVHDNGDYRA